MPLIPSLSAFFEPAPLPLPQGTDIIMRLHCEVPAAVLRVGQEDPVPSFTRGLFMLPA